MRLVGRGHGRARGRHGFSGAALLHCGSRSAWRADPHHGVVHRPDEARAVQAQLIQSQKLESVGRLAGGVAHDFNNLLLVIKGYVEMAQAEVPQDGDIARALAEVQRAADSAAALTAQMLTFSRRQIITPVVLDMNSVVSRIQTMLRRMLSEDIELQVRLAGDLWRVRFDAGQAEQILLNLAVNARDAMPSGGRLTLETANVCLDDEYVREHPGSRLEST
jgi:signal transduction histidine kinase